MSVISGLEAVATIEPSTLRGARIGLLAHQASVDRSLQHAVDVLERGVGAHVVRIFAPEHGVGGGRQDMISIDETRDPLTGKPVVSLYGEDESSLTPRAEDFDGIDVFVVDLVDVGARYYTFAATAIRALEVAARAGVRVVVLDRPNPIGGAVEGAALGGAFHSFVGEIDVPQRHGLTIGELCLLARERRAIDVELTIVETRGWDRARFWDETGLPWIAPSPNMPTLDTAIVYPGACLFEGTNLSEGRGTTRPFEWVGAPWLDAARLALDLNGLGLPGVRFRPIHFVPGFQKHAGVPCGGVQIHVRDRASFRPVLTGLAVVAMARRQDGDRFRWRTERYEFVDDRLAFDLLAGGTAWREALEAGADPREVARTWASECEGFVTRVEPLLRYGPLGGVMTDR